MTRWTAFSYLAGFAWVTVIQAALALFWPARMTASHFAMCREIGEMFRRLEEG